MRPSPTIFSVLEKYYPKQTPYLSILVGTHFRTTVFFQQYYLNRPPKSILVEDDMWDHILFTIDELGQLSDRGETAVRRAHAGRPAKPVPGATPPVLPC